MQRFKSIIASHAIYFASRTHFLPASIEEMELAPGGDGLCVGLHMWEDGEFG